MVGLIVSVKHRQENYAPSSIIEGKQKKSLFKYFYY